MAFSQVTTSNIKGLILDGSSVSLPRVNIVAVYTPTGTKHGVVSNFDGTRLLTIYRFQADFTRLEPTVSGGYFRGRND